MASQLQEFFSEGVGAAGGVEDPGALCDIREPSQTPNNRHRRPS